jgi:iron complex outermembrane receptor protein
MQKLFAPRKHILAISIASLFTTQFAIAQTAPAAPAAAEETSSTVVVTGTRVPNRSALDTTSPVDIISNDQLKQVGVTEITQALSIALPSLNFPRPGLADGTDTIRPATLRGMSADQTLVLVNSKRRHSSSLVNVNGTIGRGTAAVDMNTIPTAMVKAIEVLRDGAAAQYGSDAISGVVNIRLRTNKDGGEITTSYGARKTEYSFNADPAPAGGTWAPVTSSKRTDGETLTIGGWKGLSLGDSGYLTIAAEYKDQEHTHRGGYDMRQQYAKIGTAFDPKELTIDRFNAWYGEPEMKQSTVFANAGYNLTGDTKLYAWVSHQLRDARSAGFFRRAIQDQNVLSIYPDGFLPIIAPTVTDYSAAAGISWTMGDWDMDSSLTYGRNKMSFVIENTLNRSLGNGSKTVFDAGGFSYDQITYNLSGVKSFKTDSMSSPLNVAIGAEARREGYNLFAGEADSYRNGGLLLANGTPTPSGSQVFPGFRPSNASDNNRTAIGAYVDLEANLTKEFLASFAVRGEHYSDFGNSLAGKLAGRYDFSKNFGLRGSVQNGFRAPSPQQQYFTTTSTNFINGVPFEITTFRPGDAAAIALGAKPLDAEKSVNLSLGAVMRFDKLSVTLDSYRIKIKDRIVLSENLTSVDVRNYLTAQGFIGVGGGRFFINGVDTTTSGLDVVVSWPMLTDGAGKFDFTVAGNFSNTDVTKVPTTKQLSALATPPVLFDRINKLSLEQGQPENKISANMSWTMGALGGTLRATRYGEVLTPGTTAALDFVMSPKTVVDIEGRYAFNKNLSLAVGADNVFDTYPDAYPTTLNTTGNAPFSNYAPFGRSGRFVYGRLTYNF